MDAIESGASEIASRILAAGPNINARRRTSHETALYFATAKDNLQIVKLLVKADADPNLTDEKGQSPLFVAAILGEEEIAK